MSRILIVLLPLCSMLSACTKVGPPRIKEVHLAIWANYLPSDLQNRFEKETQIKIRLTPYSSNEELLALIQEGNSSIDVAVPSDYMVQIMAKRGLLLNLDNRLLPNRESISSHLLQQPFDPKNTYSYPYMWTTCGIAVHRDLYFGTISGWRHLLDNPALQGRIALLDDVRETLGASLLMQGYSVNTKSPSELAKAKELLMKTRRNVKLYSSSTIDILTNKEVAAAHTYSSDALQAATKAPGKIEYIIPEDGATYAIDNLVILKGTPRSDEAHKLINFLLSQEADIQRVRVLFGGPILSTTKKLLPKDLQKNEALFPSQTTLNRLEKIRDLEDTNELYESIWNDVRSK